jgi:hypothetical protein
MGFAERFPRWITAVIGLVQAALTIAIIGLELASMYLDLGHGTIWAGLWGGLVFIKASLMLLFISTFVAFVDSIITSFDLSVLLSRPLLCKLCLHF